MPPNQYLNSMAWATPGPDGSYGMPGGMQGMPQWGTPPPGAMAGAPQGGGQTPSGYTNPLGQNGFPPGYDASNTDPATMARYGYGAGGQGSQPNTMQQYGYGNRPGQGGGYYEQQTPVGSFAAANQQNASATFAQNPYIGQATSQFGNPNANPYLGQSSGQASASTNPYFGAGNPYTTQAIDAASADAARNYNLYIAPQRDAQMARSGSFGNTGVQQMQLEDQRNFGNTLGNIANSARMQDLYRQQDMGEAAANRETGVSQFNVGTRGNDLNRNLLGAFTGSGQGLQALGMDANLAQNLGIFNAGAGNQNSMFNAGQGNAMNIFNTGQGNQMLDNYRTRNQQQGQFDANLDRQIWNDNMGWMRTGNQDTMNWLGQLMGYQGQGVNAANQIQNMPLAILQALTSMGINLGNVGGTGTGTTSQDMQGNPWLGLLGGLQFGNQIFRG